MLKQISTRLIVLATILLLAWVGISCKNKRPTEATDADLVRPDNKDDEVGTSDGMIDSSNTELWEKYKNEMINIRLV